jgi:predicted transcriptional regulator
MSRTVGAADKKKREPQVRALNRAEIIDMMRQGCTNYEIADRIGVTAEMVGIEWRIILQERTHDFDDNVKELRALRREQYQYIYKESVEAWKKSKEVAEEEYVETTEGDRGSKTTEGKRYKAQSGNPAHLKTACMALEALREIEGLNPAKEIRGTLFMANWGEILSSMPKDGAPSNEVTALIEQALKGEIETPKQVEEIKDEPTQSS